MSLLTDRDLLLHQFQLAYIRHILPNHAPLHAGSAGGGLSSPYNLISFPSPQELRSQSPYLAASGSTDPDAYPELLASSRGRSSPPIALQIARRGGVLGGDSSATPSGSVTPVPGAAAADDGSGGGSGRTRRKRTTGPGPLAYTQTIVGRGSERVLSTSLGGAGMRVDATTWTGKGSVVAGGRDGNAGDLAETGVTTDRDNNVHPPPVVVHSPIKSLHATGDLTTLPILRNDGPDFLKTPANPGALMTPPTRSTPTAAGPSSPGELRSEPLVAVATAAEDRDAITAAAAAAAGPRARSRDYMHRLSRETFSTTSFSSSPGTVQHDISAVWTPYGTGAGATDPLAASVSDSSASFVETSTAVTSRRGSVSAAGEPVGSASGARDRALPPTRPAEPPSASSPSPTHAPAPAPPPNAPVFQLPPGMRIRERRRVNIRGGIPGLIAPPSATSAAAPAPSAISAPRSPQQTMTTQQEPLDSARLSARDDAAAAAGPEHDHQQRDQLSIPLRATRSRRSSVASSVNSDGSASPSTPLRPKTPRQLFPPRSEYIRASLHRRSEASTMTEEGPAAAVKSGLSLLLNAGSAAGGSALVQRMNPFSTLYAACVSRATDAVRLSLYFPHASNNKVQVGVKKDVTVEEVIGVGLWAYWEDEQLEPKLEVDEQEAREGRETVKWNLRIVEDDGQVDEDFPALDRLRQLSAFSFTEFAIVKATPQQIEDNSAKQATITRRPSRILVNAPAAIHSAVAGGMTRAAPAPHAEEAAGPGGSALAIPVDLVIRASLLDTVPHVELHVSSDMYIVDVIDLVLQHLSLESETAHDFVLVVRLADGDMVVPPDRTVESLGEQHTLELVPRSEVGPTGLRRFRPRDEQPDPAALQRRQLDTSQSSRRQIADLAGLYERFSVLRKVPLSLGGRHARVIAIDGDYLHFMPPDGMSGRTTSFHVSKIRSCSVSRRSAASFKIVVNTKRYDFETDSPERAREIVARIRQAVEAWRVEHNKPLFLSAVPTQDARLLR
ncbi:hypothetical protein JCM3774_002135 [Rhodotorula dairenensis]